MTVRTLPMDYFPYPETRKGQREMMEEIQSAVEEENQICVEAPNGFGKTCVSLCGTLPWIHENDGKILYCARTHRQLDRVMEELRAINTFSNQEVSGLSFRGRRHMCLNKFVLENASVVASISEVCSDLKSSKKCQFYENLKRSGTPETLLAKMPFKAMTAPDIIEFARKEQLCPYELAKLLAKVVDVVALSYLYVLDPWIKESFLTALETPLSDIVLIQDEAHNVPAIAIDSASDSLVSTVVNQAMREATEPHVRDIISEKFCRGLARCIMDMSNGLKDEEEMAIDPKGVYEAALLLAGLDSDDKPLDHMLEIGADIRKSLLKASRFPRSYIHRVAEFMSKWIGLQDRSNYSFFVSSSAGKGGRRISLDLCALDPTVVTSPILRRVHSSVAVSGTMSPLEAYAEMIGFNTAARLAAFQSPFASENRLGIIVQGIDTSYGSRDDQLFQQIVDYCTAVAHATPGNTGIFTTSYYIAKSLVKEGLEKRLAKPFFFEKQGMRGRENDDMIEAYKRMGDQGGAVLLGVQGGRNSEGGDFPGASMESVVVVGVPYARPNPKTEALIRYFDTRFEGRGRDYAYVLPAMTRATQAAGRPVRRLTDRGVIVLLDQRFGTPYLRRFLPKWLAEVTEVLPNSPDEVLRRVSSFFSS